jgi:small subunit ribosomal protein S7
MGQNDEVHNPSQSLHMMTSSLNTPFLEKTSPNWVRSQKCITMFMKHGEKSKATRLFSQALSLLHDKHRGHGTPRRGPRPSGGSGDAVLDIVFQAIEHVMPLVEVRKVRVAGNTLLVPAPVSPKKGESMAIRWIIEAARKKQQQSHTGFAACFADEVFDAWQKHGSARQKRDDIHRLAEHNRGYMRYRWW